MQAQRAQVGVRLEAGFQAVYLRSGVCIGWEYSVFAPFVLADFFERNLS